jgi:hypothetical protein
VSGFDPVEKSCAQAKHFRRSHALSQQATQRDLVERHHKEERLWAVDRDEAVIEHPDNVVVPRGASEENLVAKALELLLRGLSWVEYFDGNTPAVIGCLVDATGAALADPPNCSINAEGGSEFDG